MKKRLAFLLAVITVMAIVCTAASAERVYWLNYKPELDETAQALAARYTKLTGVPVKVFTAASGTYEQTLETEMDKSKAPTLFVLKNAADVREWAEYIMDLTDTPIANEALSSDYFLYDEEGRLVSIGYCFECYGIAVNPGNVEKAGHSMEELKNFAGLKAVAEDIHANAAVLGFDAFASADMDSSSSWRFTAHLANLVYAYEKRADGWTEAPAMLTGAYLDNYKALYDLMINNSISDPKRLATGGHDAANEFTSGKATFYLTGSWDYGTLSAAVPDVTMIPYYCGVEGEEKAGLNCGTENNWAINNDVSEADKQATMDFIMWLVSDPEAAGMMVENLGIIPFKNAPGTSNGFLADAAKYTEDSCYNLDWVSQPNKNSYQEALVSTLNQYNANQTEANWAVVRTAFVDGWAYNYNIENP